MKKIKNLITRMLLLNLVLISVLSIPSTINAEKGGQHDFKTGLMAEIFESIEGSTMSIVTTVFLNGEWTCEAFASNKFASHQLLDSNWSLAGEDLCLMFSDGKLIFIDDGDGTFSLEVPTQDPMFLVTTNPAINSPYIIVGDNLHRKVFYILDGQTYSFDIIFHIKRINQNQMILTFVEGSDFCPKTILCNRVLIP